MEILIKVVRHHAPILLLLYGLIVGCASGGSLVGAALASI